MSIPWLGVTHCEKCKVPLWIGEYGLCDDCKEEIKREEKKEMSKTYKGYQLIKAIADGEIKERNIYQSTRFISIR